MTSPNLLLLLTFSPHLSFFSLHSMPCHYYLRCSWPFPPSFLSHISILSSYFLPWPTPPLPIPRAGTIMQTANQPGRSSVNILSGQTSRESHTQTTRPSANQLMRRSVCNLARPDSQVGRVYVKSITQMSGAAVTIRVNHADVRWIMLRSQGGNTDIKELTDVWPHCMYNSHSIMLSSRGSCCHLSIYQEYSVDVRCAIQRCESVQTSSRWYKCQVGLASGRRAVSNQMVHADVKRFMDTSGFTSECVSFLTVTKECGGGPANSQSGSQIEVRDN